MKVLLVHNSYQERGGEDIVFEQERQLLQFRGNTVVEYRRSNAEIEQFSALQRLGLVKRTIWASDVRRDFARLLRQEKPDLVHIHNTFMMISPSIYSACREAQVPVVQTLHNYRLLCPAATFFRNGATCEECVDHSLWRGVRHACYRGSHLATAATALMLAAHRVRGTWEHMVDCYVALTAFSRDKFVEAGLPAERVRIKPNFVHPDPGARVEDGTYALFVGRLAEEKGIPTLLAAWRNLPQSIPLRIVGDGPLRNELETQLEHESVSNVRLEGRLTREQAMAAMKGARFLVFPSILYENFPLTIAEAFACGLPVIASALGTMTEIVKPRHTGLLLRPGDADDLASHVNWAWNHPGQMWHMGKQARREYENCYTAEQNYRILHDIYLQAMANHKQANGNSSSEFSVPSVVRPEDRVLTTEDTEDTEQATLKLRG